MLHAVSGAIICGIGGVCFGTTGFVIGLIVAVAIYVKAKRAV